MFSAGVTASNISRVVADTSFSLLETRGDYTDFTRLAFTVTTDAGGEVSVKADRCGGNNSQAVVTPPDGGEQFRSIMPDAELEVRTMTWAYLVRVLLRCTAPLLYSSTPAASRNEDCILPASESRGVVFATTR
jgi:hypothetical protein